MFKVWCLMFLVTLLPLNEVVAQTYRTDGGAVITEQGLALSSRLDVAYISLLEIAEPAQLEILIISSEGLVYSEQIMDLPAGIKAGQKVSLWSGGTNGITPTHWLYFLATLKTPSAWYYSSAQLPIGKPELYRETYVQGLTRVYRKQSLVLQVHGSFDTYEPILILLNDNYTVPKKAIRVISPVLVEINAKWLPSGVLPEGKFLLTVCQVSRCDSIQAKLR